MGHLRIQYSKVAGFETIALTHSKDKEELAYKLGADIVVRNGEELKNIGSSGGIGEGGSGGADVILAISILIKPSEILEWFETRWTHDSHGNIND